MAGFSIFETLHVEVNCLFVAPLNSVPFWILGERKIRIIYHPLKLYKGWWSVLEVVSFFKFAKKSNKKKKKTMIITPESFQVAASMQLVSFVNMLWNYYYELHNDWLVSPVHLTCQQIPSAQRGSWCANDKTVVGSACRCHYTPKKIPFPLSERIKHSMER